MSAIGYAVLPTTISMKGIGAQLNREFVGPATKASRDAGKRMSADMAQGASDGAAAVKRANAEVEKSTAAVADAQETVNLKLSEREIASRSLRKAELDAAAAVQRATDKVAAAQDKVTAAVRRSGEGSREAVRAEEALADARRRAESAGLAATNKIESARNRERKAASSLESSEEALARAKNKAEEATERATAATARMEDAQESASVDVRRLSSDMDDAGVMSDGLAGKFGGLVGALGGLAGVAGFGALLMEGSSVSGVIAQMNGQLGMTGAAAEAMGAEVRGAMTSGVASSAEEAAEAIGALHSQFGYLGFEGEQTAQELSDNFLAFSKTFGVDMAEATQTAGQLIENGLAADVESAADLMTAAMQRVPAAMRGELPEIINEYGTNFRALGFNGEEAFGLLVGAADKGKWALDKTGDALKEFTIRGSDMSAASVEAYGALGLSAEEMANALAEGGPAARDALTQTANALLEMEDPAARANAAIALFGTPLEDLSVDQIPQFLESLSGADGAMDGFAGSSQALSDTIAGSFQGRLDALKGTVSGLAEDAFMRLWDAAVKVSDWAQNNATWLVPLTAGLGTVAGIVGTLVVATTAWNAALAIKSTVVAIATGKQLLFNTALLASPITWVALAVAGLVAGLVVFFTKTETGQQIWETFSSALASGWEWVKGAFASAWEFIQPVMGWLGQAFEWVGEIVGRVFAWVTENWQLVVAAVFGPMGLIIGQMIMHWDTFKVAMEVVWQAVTGAIIWAWEGVIQPTLGLISTAFSLWWEGIRIILGALGDFFVWIWQGVVKPAWDALGAGIDFVWQNVIRPAWDGMKIALGAVGSFFGWVWNGVIKPAWDALGAGIAWVANNVVHPVFNGLKAGLGFVEAAFQKAVDFISQMWDRIKGIAARPVKFVIEDVYNQGIKGVWDKVAGWLGLDPLDSMPMPETLAGYASGGVLPGYTPGRDVHKFINPITGQGLHLSGGEAIMRPEWTQAIGGPSEVARQNRAAITGQLGKEEKKALRDSHHALGGVFDLAFAGGGVIDAMNAIVQQKYPGMVLTSGQRASNDNHGRGLAADFAWPGAFGPHPAQLSLANDIADTYPGSMELIYGPGFSRQIKNGAIVGDGGGSYGFYAGAGDHSNHVHWAMSVPPTMPFGGGVFEGGSDGGGGGRVSPVRSLISSAFSSIMDPIMGMVPEGPGLFGGVAKGMATKLVDSVKEFLMGKSGGSSAHGDWIGNPGVEQFRPLVEKLLREKGHPLSLTGSVLRRMNQESGGDPNAINLWDSNAAAGIPSKGLMQTIDPTFQAYKDPGYDNIWAPEDNLRASMNYAVATYGGLAAAYDRAGGYDQGGVLKEGITMAVNASGKPEAILTNQQWRDVSALVHELQFLTPEMKRWVNEGLVELERFANAAEKGFLEWSQATEEQGRMGDSSEFAAHYGNELAAELADGALGLIGLDGLIGSTWNPALAGFVEELGLALPALAPAPILDDSGRVLGTQLDRAEGAMYTASTEVGVTAQASAESRESGGTQVVQLTGDAFTAAQVKEMLSQLDGVEAEVEELKGERASIATTRKVLA